MQKTKHSFISFLSLLLLLNLTNCISHSEIQEETKPIFRKQMVLENQNKLRLTITTTRLESGEEYAEDIDLGFNLLAYRTRNYTNTEIIKKDNRFIIRYTYLESGEEYAEDVELLFNLISYRTDNNKPIDFTLQALYSLESGEEYTEDINFDFTPYKVQNPINTQIIKSTDGFVIRYTYLRFGEEYAEDVDLSFNLLSY